ncbi:MAG: purine-nucleoside phosphorylase [Bacteroidales bacterium]|nr:purine-nucleoside phosphorylase [Bacteroidales bacterium]
MLETIKETATHLKLAAALEPKVGIILGSGLAGLTKEIDIKDSFPYTEIPNFPVSTVDGHHGELIFGYLNEIPVVAMKGRFHYYEGYSMDQLTFPIRVMKQMGIQSLILSNAAGGVNPDFQIGDIMFIYDHINLMGDNPLIGLNNNELGPRFLDMSEPYDRSIIEKAQLIAGKMNIPVKKGIYAAVSGPTYETPAEYTYIRTIGADAVGMSTIPEVIAARHMDLPCFAVSIISDLGVQGKIVEISHEDVLEAASAVEPKLAGIIKELVPQL